MYVKFAELPVKNQDRAISFYTTHLGMQVNKDASYGGDEWRWVELSLPGGQTNLLFTQSTTRTKPTSPTLALMVESVERLFQQLHDAGVEIKQTPQTAPWDPSECSASFYDSEDNLVLITSRGESAGSA